MNEAVEIKQNKVKKKHPTNDAFAKRIHEVDFLRGFLMFLVLFDHFCWCMKAYNFNWFGPNNTCFEVFNFYWTSNARAIIRYIALFGFTFLSGISCAFSRNNWKRAGLMILVFGLLATGSNLLDSWHILNQVTRIDFNVIGVLAWSTLLFAFFEKRTWKSLLAMSLIGCLITVYLIPLLKEIPGSEDAFVPGLWEPTDVLEADYMPLFPFMVFFFLGALASKFIYRERRSIFPHKGEWERPICFVGRHSFFFYILHQFILIPFFEFVGLFIV